MSLCIDRRYDVCRKDLTPCPFWRQFRCHWPVTVASVVIVLMFLCMALGDGCERRLTKKPVENETAWVLTGTAQITNSKDYALVIECKNGQVRIPYDTGIAEYNGCKPDEATRVLWNGLKPYFEKWKQEVCEKRI